MTFARAPHEITMFISDMEMGGAQRVFLTLARQFLDLGHGVRLILASRTGALLSELDPRIEIINLAAGTPLPAWRFGARTLWRLSRELRLRPPEAMLSTLTGANLVAITARLLSGRHFPLVVREASSLSNVRGWLRLLAMRLLYRHADRVIALTPHMSSQLASALRLDERHLEVIGNPLDIERIKRLSLATEELQDITSLQPYIVALGRLVPEKDYATLIRAAAKARTLRIVIIGDGPQRPKLEALIQQLDLGATVHLLGSRINPYPWLRHAAGFVLCSRWEGYPNALMEAMHFGLPLAVARYDASVRSLLHAYDPRHVQLIECGDSNGLSLAIKALVAHPPTRPSGGTTGHRQDAAQSIALLLTPCRRPEG